jgi:hypothetical protein
MVGHDVSSLGKHFTAWERPLERKAASRREMLP